MTYALRVHTPGDFAALVWEPVPVAEPGIGEIVVRHTAVGVNFLDVLIRRGDIPLSNYPAVLGSEGAGIVEAVGEGVTHLKPGDRVAYTVSLGSYAERRIVLADRVLRLPDTITDDTAAAILMKGLTANFLLTRINPWLKRGDTVLFHAAAGGVGLVFCQWARHLGITVIGTVSSPEKAEIARANGCDHVIVGYDYDATLATVREVTDGAGVAMACDAVGAITFKASFDALRRRGMLVNFGRASGLVPAFGAAELYSRGLYVTSSHLGNYTAGDDLAVLGTELFDLVEAGVIKAQITGRYPLREAGRAHADIEARRSTGSLVLV